MGREITQSLAIYVFGMAKIPVLTNALYIALYIVATQSGLANAGIRGNVSVQSQHVTENTNLNQSPASNLSLSGSVEYYHDMANGNDRLTITPFIRLDENDDNRNHADFREFNYKTYTDLYEFEIGLGSVFWGVAESRNVVDVINQSDSVEGPQSREKLGQPMLHLTRILDSGNVELYILPGFRKRTYADQNARPAPDTHIDSSVNSFESSKAEKHVDVALRYSGSRGNWDFGFAFFQGTSRDPLLQPTQNPNVASPYYFQMRHFSFDVQATLDSWLLKAELVHQRASATRNHNKLVTGLEYSVYSLMGSSAEIGLIAEYIYDGLGEAGFSVLQNDLLAGLRFAMNDEQSSEVLMATSFDFDSSDQFLTIEASRRLGNNLKASIEAATFRHEYYFAVELGWYF